MARISFTAAEWDALSAGRQALITGCTDFNLGELVLGEDGNYTVNHPSIRLDDMVRAFEAFNVPVRDLPTGTAAEPVTRAQRRAVVEARLRPEEGVDRIKEFKDSLTTGSDIDAALRNIRR